MWGPCVFFLEGGCNLNSLSYSVADSFCAFLGEQSLAFELDNLAVLYNKSSTKVKQVIQRVKRTHSLWRCLNLWSYVWSGHKHAVMCMLWPYFLFLTLDRTVQKMQISYSYMYILAFGLIKIYFYSCLPLIWSILLLCSFSLFYSKVISENLCRQYSAFVIYESW